MTCSLPGGSFWNIAHPVRNHVLLVKFFSTQCFPVSSARAYFTVCQAFLFGQVQCLGLDEQPRFPAPLENNGCQG